jgi:hypothetical protein
MKIIFKKSKKQKGYAILFTVVIVSAISVITAGLSNAAYKQLVLSSLAKDSQAAFYQADTASDCALYADQVNPSGIVTTGGSWSCGGSDLIVTPTTNGGYTVYPTEADENSSNACFRIDVTKTLVSGGTTPSWESGLVSWWKLDGDASDSVGSNDGTVNGATPTSTDCKIGQCYNFNGSDYIVKTGASTINSQFTVGAWVKPLDDTNPISIFGTRSVDYGFDMKFQSGDTIHGDIGNGTSWITTTADASFSYTTGTWYHVIYVVNATSYTIYVNGNNVDSGTYASDTPLFSNATHNIYIGQSGASGDNEFFNGSIDEAMVWNRALSSSEIQDLYNWSGTNTSAITETKISAKGYNICKKSNTRTVEREIQINYKE